MSIRNYHTGEYIGFSTSIDREVYATFLSGDHPGTGAVRAGDWLSPDEIDAFGIDPDLTIFAE